MSNSQQQFGVPGQTVARFNEHVEFLWGGDVTRIPMLQIGAVIDGTAREDNAALPTVLNSGLLMGKITASGKWKEYDPAAVDGSENVAGVLMYEHITVDPFTGANVENVSPILVHGPLKTSALRIEGSALIGHASEAATKTALRAAGFFLDEDY